LLREWPPLGSGAGANHNAFVIAAVWEEEAADGGGRFEEEAASRFEEEADGGGGDGDHRRSGSTAAGAEMGRPNLRKRIQPEEDVTATEAPTKRVNAGAHNADTVAIPSEIIPYYRLNHSIWS
jgi:hypothetical protein